MGMNVDHRHDASAAQAGQGGEAATRKPHSANDRREPCQCENVAVCDPVSDGTPASAAKRRAPKLDARLRMAADWVEPCRTCADIGCDHGRLGAVLLMENRCQWLLAADVSAKALAKAQACLSALTLTDRAVFSAADGLDALAAIPQGKADTVCILGMGGETLAGILLRGQARLQGATLVLGAQTELPTVRETLMRIGYRLTREQVAQADGRLYLLMQAKPAPKDAPPYTERELRLGPVLLTEMPLSWRPWLTHRQRLLGEAIAAMRQAVTPDEARLSRLADELWDTEEALRAMPVGKRPAEPQGGREA